MTRIALALLVVATITACSPQDFESDPVVVETPKGTIVCQLYTHELVEWDRSIARPEGMSAETANSICRNVGQGILDWNDI